MSHSLAQTALLARLSAMPATPTIAWPNIRLPDGITPRFEVTVFRNKPQRLAIGSSFPQSHPGILQVTIVTAEGEHAATADSFADALSAWFPTDRREFFTGGYLRITHAAQAAGGFPDASEWRTPVSIYYDAIF